LPFCFRRRSVVLTGYILVYDFEKDKERIKDIQDATLNTIDFGLQIEHGLVGSDEWWLAIDKGLFSKIVIEGTISRVFMSGHNDYPEFELLTKDGRSNWSRMANTASEDDLYVGGRKARITYIEQKFKKSVPGIGIIDKFVLTIEVGKK